jgi:hypothetical protein
MVFEIVLLSFALSSPPPRKCSTDGDQVLHFDSNGNKICWTMQSSITPEASLSVGLEDALAQDLASIPEVRHVLTERVDGSLLVWIAIDDAGSYDVRSQVYEKELGIIDGFPEVNFDFNLIPAMNRNANQLATGAQVVYSRA